MHHFPPRCALLLLGLASLAAARAQPASPAEADFKKLSLEDLLSLEVTSVSRHAEKAIHAAAAVEVVTPEQIARTGATSVQDALRLVPGVQVSEYGGDSFAISARGFASLAANKLQVMQDGRSLYSPLFSGVFWDAYATMLEDIDRIEVIRGPGATMWGANAVNGVVNIITKDARDTPGALVAFGGGTEERAFGAVRYGGRAGATTDYRVYARFQERDALARPSGRDGPAAPAERQTGFRIDSRPARDRHLTLQGDYFQNESDTATGERAWNRSTNLLGRWTREFSAESELRVQGYFDRFERRVPAQMGERRNTFDLDAQYRSRFGARHDLGLGFGYRLSADHTARGGTLEFSPAAKTVEIASAFVQDEIALLPRQLALVLGAKFQWDSLAGLEPQPNVRLLWTPDERQTWWAALSRAVRMPTRIDEDLRFTPVPATGTVFIRGNPNFSPEILHAFEIGYRVRPSARLFVDVAGFFHDYADLRSLEPTPPTGIPLVQFNRLRATTTGLELAVKFDATRRWRLNGSFSYLQRRLLPEAASRDPNRGTLEGNDAPRLVSLWSSMDLPRRWTLDVTVRHVGALPEPRVPAYTEADVRLGWRPRDGWELALIGQNLLHRQHLEFGAPSPATAEVERGFYGKATWRF
jgi:iron complex outermembrane receptor protein